MSASPSSLKILVTGWQQVEHPTDIADQIRALLAQADPDPVQLGRLLRAGRQHASTDELARQAGLRRRKTYDLLAIAGAVDTGKLTAAEVRALGWGKARAIATHAETRAEAKGAVAFASQNTSPALVAYLQGKRLSEGLITKSFHLTAAQATLLERKLRQAGARISGGRMQNRAEALMTILRAFNTTPRSRTSNR